MIDHAARERRSRSREDGYFASADEAIQAEQADKYAGVVRIERGPAAYRVTFPQLTSAERGTDAARAAWDLARRPMADVKAMMGRKYDSVQAAWIVPLDQSASIECLALDYSATIEQAADDIAAARIAELEYQLAELTAAYEDVLAHDCAATVAGLAVAA